MSTAGGFWATTCRRRTENRQLLSSNALRLGAFKTEKMTDSVRVKKVLEDLEALAERLGIQIAYSNLREDELPAAGGLCKLRGKYKIFIDRNEGTGGRIKILARALSSFDTEGIYLLPQIREILERGHL